MARRKSLKQWWLMVVLAGVGLLAGCVRVVPPTAVLQSKRIPRAVRVQRLSAVQRFSFRGALSLVLRNRQPILANYIWRQTSPSVFDLRIASALSIYQAHLVGQAHQVTLYRANQPPRSASTVDALTQQLFGRPVPVSSLYYWVRGLAAPGQHQAQLDQDGHLIDVKQQGWHVVLSHFATDGLVDLPNKLVLRRQGYVLTLVVKQRQLGK